ncbi:hypothetical protein B0H19DRAFT_1077886 [Mycena capillaripes]|nr:hypothetical protein B0H19DRAFT_1077886 [Mycena capillaripes]
MAEAVWWQRHISEFAARKCAHLRPGLPNGQLREGKRIEKWGGPAAGLSATDGFIRMRRFACWRERIPKGRAEGSYLVWERMSAQGHGYVDGDVRTSSRLAIFAKAQTQLRRIKRRHRVKEDEKVSVPHMEDHRIRHSWGKWREGIQERQQLSILRYSGSESRRAGKEDQREERKIGVTPIRHVLSKKHVYELM